MSTQPNPASSASSPGAGAILRAGRYRLRQKLGQGGMGSVYLAEDTLLPGRLVAIKENADTSADAQAQFKREALLLARLRHPNLPQVMDYFIEADGKQYLVMDYVPGDNLLELMRKRQGPLPAAEALAIVEQVMQALAYMHTWRDPDSGRTRPIIHRDIKPANIKRTPEGRVVLVDFGIAKVDSGTMTGTAVSAKALTPGYAPLEQYGGGTDARSDIYSLGATLYALLTGKAPPSATDMAMAADKERAPLLTGLKGIPPAAAKVIERAMQSLPKDRYQSIAAMHQALYGRSLPSAGVVSQPPPARQGMAGSRRLGWLVAALGVLLAMGMGWLLLTQSGEFPGTPVAVLPTTPAPGVPLISPEATQVIKTRELSVNVYANQGWQDTGIQVSSGDVLAINDISGFWSPWPNYLLDSRGCTDPVVCSQDTSQPANVSPVARHAALIGRIGNTEPFVVENSEFIEVKTSGKVLFRINDLSIEDNSGALTIKMQIAP